MRHYYDTEFLEDGETVRLISIGIVSEDGREYYAVNSEMPTTVIARHDWLCKNVVPNLPVWNPDRVRSDVEKKIKDGAEYNTYPGNSLSFNLDPTSIVLKPKWVIANEVREFFRTSADISPVELWSWYGAYDHVALMQLWGPMVKRPLFLPMYTRDIQQEADRLGMRDWKPEQEGTAHNALDDAHYHQTLHRAVMEYEFGIGLDGPSPNG